MRALRACGAAAWAALLIVRLLLVRATAPLRREVRMPWEKRPPQAAPSAEAAAYGQTGGAPRKRSSADLKGMRRELALVLDEHDGSREVFRYLAHFERQLEKKGLRVLDEMPVKRLRRALAQFEAIVTNWSSTNLAELRSRMAVAVSIRDSGAAMWLPAATISKAYVPQPMPMLSAGQLAKRPEFESSRQLEAGEVSLTRFEQALGELSWATRQALFPQKTTGAAH
jgi:hypothetical protein